MKMTVFSAAATALFLGACSTHVQTTSGADYLARSGPVTVAPETITHRTPLGDGAEAVELIRIASTDELVRKAAAVEPILTLPARIGLARIENGQLTIIPANESAIWAGVAANHPGMGTAVAIDPFLAEFTARTVLPHDQRRLRRDANDLITKIRLGAARQHIDAVLIYEIGTNVVGDRAIKGLGRIKVLGGVQLRTTTAHHAGVARALLLNVRNGYPYATISATADLDGVEPDFWESDGDAKAYLDATTRIARALGREVDETFEALIKATSARLAAK